jgi:hypothetical protein
MTSRSWLVMGALVACSGDDDPIDPSWVECWDASPPYARLAEAELGGGDERTEAFEPLAPGEAVGLFFGPQGGYHILVRPRVRGLTPSDQGRIDTRFSATLGDERVDPFECPHHPIYTTDPTDGDYLVGTMTTLIIANERVADVLGQPIRIRMEALDRSASYASDERTVVPYLVEPDGSADAGPTGDDPDAAAR